MVVILAGCDGTGKSTCFNKLKGSLNANFIKESYTPSEVEKIVRSQYTIFKSRDNYDLTIYDRATILDDLVYQRVFANRKSNIPLMVGFNNVKDALNSCLIIYFDLDDYELTKRIESRGDEYVSVHQINKIKDSYKKTMKEFGLHPTILDVTGLSEEDVYNTVKGIIEEYEKSKDCTNRSC